jgi:hypothetical protein
MNLAVLVAQPEPRSLAAPTSIFILAAGPLDTVLLPFRADRSFVSAMFIG